MVEGGVKYVQTVIVDPDKKGKKTQTMKFPVKQLFADAPDTAAYSWTRKFSEFTFSAWENLQRLWFYYGSSYYGSSSVFHRFFHRFL